MIWILAGACFAPAIVAALIAAGVHGLDPTPERRETAARWGLLAARLTVYAMFAATVVAIVALAI